MWNEKDLELLEELKVTYDKIKPYLPDSESIVIDEGDEALECLSKLDSTFYLTKYRTTEGGTREEYEFYPSYTNEYYTIEHALQRLKQIDIAVKICKKANEQKYVYIKETYGIVKEKFLDDLDYEVINNRLYVNSRGMYYDFPLKDYGNWWALTKEELENE